MRSVGILAVALFLGSAAFGQQPASLTPDQARKLAELMCRQLPNLTSFPDAVKSADPDPPQVTLHPAQDPPVFDDVEDTLMLLGPYSLPCLVDKMSDARWMPDPRMEPLLGSPTVGDVAYMVLGEKGVPDFIPTLAHRKPESLRMDFYYLWPARGDNRARLQASVRDWVSKHPRCCGRIRDERSTHPPRPITLMSPGEIESARLRFAQLRLGMPQREALAAAGEPDAAEQHERIGGGGGFEEPGLVGSSSASRNETGAAIYYVQRWNASVLRRDPLRDRYVILYFSADGKLTRMFSNVPEIPPRFPKSTPAWLRIAGMR